MWLPTPEAGNYPPWCLRLPARALFSPAQQPLRRGSSDGDKTWDSRHSHLSSTPNCLQNAEACWPGQRSADFLFPKWKGQRASGPRHIHAHTHREGKEQYNLKTACKSVKQISMAWISQIIEPQSITNIKCIWPWGRAQLKNANGNLLGTWKP